MGLMLPLKVEIARELEEKERIQDSIIYFASSLFRQNTVDDILWDIAVNCIENLGFVDCVIYLLDQERNILIQKAAHGPKNEGDEDIVAPIEIPPGKGIVGSVALTGKPELVGDVSNDERYILDDEQRFSELAVPIVSPEGEILGVIDSEHPDKGFFNEMHLKVLTVIASICAVKLIKAKADEVILSAKNAAEEATKTKSQFLSTMSHEIRTPLNAVIGLSHILLNENPRNNQVQNLETLHFSANHLLSLLNDILDFSKLESGKFVFEAMGFDLNSLINKLYRSFECQAKQKQLSLVLDAPQFLYQVRGDSVRLSQILTNLIGNALKFTSEGSIQLILETETETSGQISILFRVKDTGIGIPLDKQALIFNQFEQANNDTSRKYGGTGLGLAICKKLVQLQGGEIGVRSEPGDGAEFWFRLTFEKGKPIENALPEKESSMAWKNQKLSGMKVLLVEDNKVNRMIGTKFLKRWNINTETAENGRLAVEKLIGDTTFDVILMDLNMPEMGGIEAAGHIRSMTGEYYQNVPIIALTADVSPNIHEETRMSGMNDYLSKPFDPEKLFELLGRFYYAYS